MFTPEARTVSVYGEPMLITVETILAARQAGHDNSLAVVEDCQNETDPWFAGWDQERKDKCIAYHRQRAAEFMAGDNDHTLAFLQACVQIQTGECVPLLGK